MSRPQTSSLPFLSQTGKSRVESVPSRPQTSLPFTSHKRNSRNVHVEEFKPHALKVAEAARARARDQEEEGEHDAEIKRLAEIREWTNQIVDLHRVLSVSQSVFLLLEQNNEALLRVAIEIATCSDAQKVLWWRDGWYSDERAREWFRKQVKNKLTQCLHAVQCDVPLSETDDTSELTQALTSRAEAAEQKCRAMETLQENTENQLREVKQSLEHALGESASHVAELEKSLEKMRDNLKSTLAAAEDKPVDAVPRKSLEEAQQRVRLLEEQKKKIEEKLVKVESEHCEHVSKSQVLMSEAQGKVKELESQVRQLTRRLQLEEERARKQCDQFEVEKRAAMAACQRRSSDHVSAEDNDPEKNRISQEELKNWLALEQSRVEEFRSQADHYKTQVSALECETITLKDDITFLKQKLAEKDVEIARQPDERAKSHVASGCPKGEQLSLESELCNSEPRASDQDLERLPRARKTIIDQEEYQKVVEKLEQARERNINLRESNSELKEENEAYEKKNMQLLRMLHQVKDQLKRITELAEKKGHGKLVKEIMEESKVSQTFESAEFSAFDRLWQDAKRREERQKMMQEVKMGLRSKSDIEEWDANHGVTVRNNGKQRGSFTMPRDELEGPQQLVATPSISNKSSLLCQRCGGEIAEGCQVASSTRSSAWPAAATNMCRSDVTSNAESVDAPRSGTAIASDDARREVSQSPQKVQVDFQAANSPPTNGLRRPRTGGVPSRNLKGEGSKVESQTLSLFQVQGQGLKDGEFSAGNSNQSFPAGQTVTNTVIPFDSQFGCSQNQLTGNRDEPTGGDHAGSPPQPSGPHSSTMKLPTIIEKPATMIGTITPEKVSSFQEAMNALGMQGSSASAPNLHSALGNALASNILSKRSKTPVSKVGGLKRLPGESNSPPLCRSGIRPMTAGLVMRDYEMHLSASAPTLAGMASKNLSHSILPKRCNTAMSKIGGRKKLLSASNSPPLGWNSHFSFDGLRPMTSHPPGLEVLSPALEAS
mmetsp:Transcript_150813/g.281369  ORF Transcript_150813/g.281369 Transcript_150813/m.281369 type:complete len:1002 (-) Transcript_150813:124-3129(-)